MNGPLPIPDSSGGASGGKDADAAQLLSYLADGTRLRILMILAEGEHRVGALCKRIGRPQPSVSHHPSFLRLTGMVHTRREGRAVYYSLKTNAGESALSLSHGGVTVTVEVPPPSAETESNPQSE